MSRLLLVEDEEVIRNALRRMLTRHGHTVSEAGTVAEALRYDLSSFDLILADLRLPGADGTTLIPHAKQTPVLVMTSYASVRSAVESMKQGAVDYIAKPFDHHELLTLIDSIIHKPSSPNIVGNVATTYPISGMLGQCALMQEVFARIQRVAPVDMTVLVTGESGTGKELVARALHEHSPRRNGPIIVVNCAAIPDSLVESELFGHEKGAFTGAHERRAGLAEAAHGGTLFLDEIGELPAPAQARLLRLLETKEVRPVGSSQTKRVDIRLVAATNRNLPQRVAEGEFRADLYYRLQVMEIHLPPLRERENDVLELAQAFLQQTCQQHQRSVLNFAPETVNAIRNYRWPGNVRELKHAIERAVVLCDGSQLLPQQLGIATRATIEPLAVTASVAAVSAQAAVAETVGANPLSLDDYFRHFVLTHQGDLSETELARRLGISRKTLWERRQRMGIPRV